MDRKQTESLEGYIVDLACVRRYPLSEMLERARRHTKKCALMGHCVESGYGLVQEDGTIVPLDTHATPLVVDAASRTGREAGIRVRIRRRMEDEEMRTESVESA